ncbi:MAG: aminotransferase class I/II-fold pyridoxal phosphate-dependent enzyme [Deltaproteobacteria bacterium]|nr:aminotransferase class I/II-fold pyridoxal phosphate-dependent enzyme [Deltaproteobacteria bacterium]
MNNSTKSQIQGMLIQDDSTVRDALRQLNQCATGLLFVIGNDECMVGIVTDGDIRRNLLHDISLEDSISKVMNRDFIFVREGEISTDVLRRIDKRVKYLPVLDAKGRITDFYYLESRPNIPVAKTLLAGNEAVYVNECIATNWVSSQGHFVRRFEREFAAFCGVSKAVATCNGTAALHLALAALEVGPGDEVIVPSLTFIATANAVRYTGATPVFVDVCPDTWTIDPVAIASAINDRTRAVIVVHLYGQPAHMDEIINLASKKEIYVIEDAAEAHGAKYKGRPVGGIGHVGCFSFFGNKILTTGEGGMLTTDDLNIIRRARILRDHGMDPERKYFHPYLGFNYRMTNLQAALGCAQLERVDDILLSKKKIYQWYIEGLKDISVLEMPPNNEWSESVYWMFSVILDEEKAQITRDQLLQALKDRNVEGRPLFYPAHLMPIYNTGQTLPVTENLSHRGFSLPSYAGLTKQTVSLICEDIKTILRSKNRG